jgi:serine/threonine-protein kinase
VGSLEEKRFAELAVKRQFVKPDQATDVLRAVEEGAAQGQARSVSETFVQKGYLTETQKEFLVKAVAESGPLKIGDFEIIEELGRGGMGAVYKAREISLDRVCALKLLPAHLASDPTVVVRFHREAQACAKLDHPHIVRAYRVGEADGQHYFAMELVEGTSVEKMLEGAGPMPTDRAVEIAKQIAGALAQAHKAGIIHRDIKPANILITTEGVTKLADLGLAREMNADLTRVTQSGTGMGTPAYMPPEQATGAKNADARSDIYALGATLYHMVTGKVPYEGSSAYEVIQMHLEGRLKSPRSRRAEVPAWLDLVVSKMMQRKPENRFQTAEELLAALERGSPSAATRAAVAAKEKVVVDRLWHLHIKRKDGLVRRLKMDRPALRQLLIEGRIPRTALARKGQEGSFRPVSEYPELMEALTSGKGRKEKLGDTDLKAFYKKVETAAEHQRRMARIKRIVLLCLKIAIVIAVLLAGYAYRHEIVGLFKKLSE